MPTIVVRHGTRGLRFSTKFGSCQPDTFSAPGRGWQAVSIISFSREAAYSHGQDERTVSAQLESKPRGMARALTPGATRGVSRDGMSL